MGFMKHEIALWLGVGSALGFLAALFFENVHKKIKPEKLMWTGFLLVFPVMFFSNQLKGTFGYDVFGILALIGVFTLIVNFGNVRRKKKKK